MNEFINSQTTNFTKCNHCDKNFASKGNLTKHLKICKKEKVVGKVPEDQTMKNAAKVSDSSAVRKTIVAFECEHCNKLFRTKEALVKHLKEHTIVEESDEDSSSDDDHENVENDVYEENHSDDSYGTSDDDDVDDDDHDDNYGENHSDDDYGVSADDDHDDSYEDDRWDDDDYDDDDEDDHED